MSGEMLFLQPASLKSEGEPIEMRPLARITARRGFEYMVPEWIGVRIRNAAFRIYDRFDIYGH